MQPKQKQPNRLFGTDGIRGTPGEYPLTDGMIFKIGTSIGKIIRHHYSDSGKSLQVVIGRDTRMSGIRIEAIIIDAIILQGVDVLLAGVITTPGIAFLVNEFNAQMGIMISASHNKATDNGLKFFNKDGYKLSLEDENLIESFIFNNIIHAQNGHKRKHIAQVSTIEDARQRYIRFLAASVKEESFAGFKIVVDCAWGAASGIAYDLYNLLGAEVVTIHDTTNSDQVACSDNINEGGAMNPFLLRDTVLKEKADIGIAIDGDGDRCILVDEKGNILDGDHILAITSSYLKSKNKLSNNAVVGTVMTNLGLKKYFHQQNIDFYAANVGDKYVLEKMLQSGAKLGGEQSGHILFLNLLPSPDGLLTSLQVLQVLKHAQQPLSKLASVLVKYPQVLVNVVVNQKVPFEEEPQIVEAVEKAQARLGEKGRILLRYSGTEKLARVMVEGEDEKLINEIAAQIANVIDKTIGINTAKKSSNKQKSAS